MIERCPSTVLRFCSLMRFHLRGYRNRTRNQSKQYCRPVQTPMVDITGAVKTHMFLQSRHAMLSQCLAWLPLQIHAVKKNFSLCKFLGGENLLEKFGVHANGGIINGGVACVCAKWRVPVHFCAFWRIFVRFILPKWPAKKRKLAHNSAKMCKKRFYAIPPLVIPPFCVSPKSAGEKFLSGVRWGLEHFRTRRVLQTVFRIDSVSFCRRAARANAQSLSKKFARFRRTQFFRTFGHPLTIYKGLSGPPGLKPQKSLKKVSRGLRPRGPPRARKKSRKSPFGTFFQTLETFRNFLQTLGGVPGLVARAIRNAIRANQFAQIIRN